MNFKILAKNLPICGNCVRTHGRTDGRRTDERTSIFKASPTQKAPSGQTYIGLARFLGHIHSEKVVKVVECFGVNIAKTVVASEHFVQ